MITTGDTMTGTDATTLAGRVAGPVLLPGQDGYADELTGFQRGLSSRPEVAVGVAETRDVTTAVSFAAARGLTIGVQAAGHGLTHPADGGMVISTRRMREVQVDPQQRTAWVSAGASWADVIEATAPHGLAPLSGSFPGVGAVSYTLGGGVGLLARRYGFAADHVHRFELVTPDGQVHDVTAEGEPELFWALRGGGGNFGVVTGMGIELMPVSRLYGGGLYLDTAQVPEALETWRSWTRTVPDEMTSAVAMLPFPDIPAVPEPLRGRHSPNSRSPTSARPNKAGRSSRPLRALGPLLDTVGERPFAESGAVFDEPDEAHAYRAINVLTSDLDPGALSPLLHRAGPQAPVPCVVGCRHLGGALARPPQIPSAVGHRDAAYLVSILSPAEPGREGTVAATHRHALAPFADRSLGCSLNFTFAQLTPDQIASAFEPGDYQRLAAVKASHDPQGLLDCNHPIQAPGAGIGPDGGRR